MAINNHSLQGLNGGIVELLMMCLSNQLLASSQWYLQILWESLPMEMLVGKPWKGTIIIHHLERWCLWLRQCMCMQRRDGMHFTLYTCSFKTYHTHMYMYVYIYIYIVLYLKYYIIIYMYKEYIQYIYIYYHIHVYYSCFHRIHMTRCNPCATTGPGSERVSPWELCSCEQLDTAYGVRAVPGRQAGG